MSRLKSADPSPELKLILYSARTHVDELIAGRIRTLTRSPLDWDRVLELAGKHGVRPLLYQTLRECCWDAVPPDIRQSLEGQIQAVTHHNLRLTAELVRLLPLLEGRGIKPIILKGPALAESVYASVGLRESGDLDLLVREAEFPAVKELMLAEGYELQFQFTHAEEREFIRQGCEFEFRRAGLLVEVHWRLAPAFHGFPLDLGSKVVLSELAGQPILTPAPEYQLLFLCLHGSKHLWFSLKWICDVAELLRSHQGLDWEAVLQEARRVGARRMLTLGVKLAHDLLDAPVPEAFRQPDRAVDQVAAQIILGLEDPVAPNTTGIAYGWTILRLRERVRDRLRYCLLVVTPTPGDWAEFRLPRFLWFLYYLARPWRILRKYGRRRA
jgi:Uncharacterised nucleotidyltransferase